MATLRATNLRGRSANDAPNLPDGANITGVCTATSFAGDGSSLTGIDATTVKDSGGTTRVAGNTSGIVVTGVSTFNGSLINQVNAGECQIRAGYNTTKYVQIGRASSGSYEFISQENGSSLEFGTAESADGGGAAKFYIDRYGKVGVGEASPNNYSSGANNLVITAASGSNAGITINNDSGGTDSGGIFFAHGSGANAVGRVRYHHDADYMAFTVSNSEGLRIDMGGNVNIAGVCTATSFAGDGSALTNLPSSGVTTTSQYSASGIITINLGSGQAHEVTLAAGISTITVTGGTVGESHSLIITQPSSGITTVGFSTYFLWPSGSVPNLSKGSASSEIDMITFVVKQQTQTGTGVTQLLASAGLDYH